MVTVSVTNVLYFYDKQKCDDDDIPIFENLL